MIVIGTPHTHNSGYYRSDESASGGQVVECDVQTCAHCQRILLMQESGEQAKINGRVSWKEDGGFCGRCMKPICGPCADRMLTRGCEPFIKQIEAAMESAYRRKVLATV